MAVPAASLKRLTVIGAGAWGTALALVATRGQRPVTLWAYEPEIVQAINRQHRNPFLPDVDLPQQITATGDLAAAADADAILLAAPAQHLRALTARLAPLLAQGAALIICAKGIELDTCKLLSEVLAETCPGASVAVLSGPTFAAEVAAGKPTAITLAATDAAFAATLVAALGSPVFRPYVSDDVIGAQIGGAVKNVIAIACGIVDGRGLGDNARAALLTRGLAEIVRLGMALGGRRETLVGLSGLGDLALTCSSRQSRNMSLGVALGEGKSVADALAGRRTVAEGVATAAAVTALAARHAIEMPIVAAVNAILHQGAAVERVIAGLLERPFRNEG